jgi:hypothetical protein
LDGDGFILQVHGVFTHIRSGATAVALSGGALGSTLHSAEAARTGVISNQNVLGMATAA